MARRAQVFFKRAPRKAGECFFLLRIVPPSGLKPSLHPTKNPVSCWVEDLEDPDHEVLEVLHSGSAVSAKTGDTVEALGLWQVTRWVASGTSARVELEEVDRSDAPAVRAALDSLICLDLFSEYYDPAFRPGQDDEVIC